MDFNFLKSGAIAGLVIGFWDKIKSILWKLLSVIIERVEITTEDADEAIIGYLVNNYKALKTYDKSYGASNESLRSGKYGLVAYEKYGNNSMFFVYKFYIFKFLLLYSKATRSGSNSREDNTNSNDKIVSTITCLRRTLDIDKIFCEAAKMKNKQSWDADEYDMKKNRFDIYYFPNREDSHVFYQGKYNTGFAWYRQSSYRLLGLSTNDIGRKMSSSGKALDNLFYPQEVKELIKIIELWIKSENWYRNKNIPWKKGWLLYGPPGTGKTALVRAFAEDLCMPIYVFSLSQMSNDNLTDAWKSMQLNIPCIALIEDIDNVFNGRNNISSNNNVLRVLNPDNNNNDRQENSHSFTPLTFDCLLNCIDGIDKSDGVFTIITTNDITKIDSAIGGPSNNDINLSENKSTRPGRIDNVINLTYMNKDNKLQMAKKILGEYNEKLIEVESYIEKNLTETPAQFQEYCAQIAIKEFWKNQLKN